MISLIEIFYRESHRITRFEKTFKSIEYNPEIIESRPDFSLFDAS